MKKFELHSIFEVNVYDTKRESGKDIFIFSDKIHTRITGEPDKDDKISYTYSFDISDCDHGLITQKMRARSRHKSSVYSYRSIKGFKMYYFIESNTKKIKEALLKKTYADILSFYQDIIYPDYGIFITLLDSGYLFLSEYRTFRGKIKVNDTELGIRLVLDNSRYDKNTYDILAYNDDCCYGLMERKEITDIDIAKNTLSCYAMSMYMQYRLKNNEFNSLFKMESIEPFVEEKQ